MGSSQATVVGGQTEPVPDLYVVTFSVYVQVPEPLVLPDAEYEATVADCPPVYEAAAALARA